MKKLSAISVGVLAASLFLTSSAFAAHNYKGEAGYKDAPCPPAERGLQSGWYLGGQVGYDIYQVSTSAGSSSPIAANPKMNSSGFIGGLFGGYGQYFNDWYYLGAELTGSYVNSSSTWSANQSTNSYTNKFNAYSSWGLAVLPGLKVNVNSLLYVRLGYNWDRVKSQESFTTATTSGSTSTSKWSNGFVYGLGLESVVSGNWSVRTEYNRTNNNSFTSSFGTKYNPNDNQVLVGLIYHFV